jgi:hypothetical protein
VLQAAIEGAQVFVPAVWRLEIANALVVAERRGKNPPEDSAEFLNQLRSLKRQPNFVSRSTSPKNQKAGEWLIPSTGHEVRVQ